MAYISVTNYNGYNFDLQRLEKLTRKSRIMQKKEIINVYMDRVYKVRKPAPLVRKSSFINRKAKERKTDRINFILLQKLLYVKNFCLN